MPTFTENRDIIVANFKNPATAKRAIMLEGEPGCAKSSMGPAVAEAMGFGADRVRSLHPVRRNPVDFCGLPMIADGHMEWAEPAEILELTTGKWIVMIEELAQCGAMMQNAMAGLVLDRYLNKAVLSPDAHIIITSNRVQDKAGARAVMTHFANRVMRLPMTYSIDDFIPYGIDKGLDVVGLAFLSNYPQYLIDFDPDRAVNATARSWEYALSMDPDALPEHLYLHALSGILPEGIATTYMGFRKVAARMPNKDEIERSPRTAPIPKEVDVKYAITASLIVTTDSPSKFEHYLQYMARMEPEFQTLFVHTCVNRVPGVSSAPAYINWTVKNRELFGSR